MPQDMGPVGHSAAASKKAISGTEELTSVEITPSENGGFTVSQRYKMIPPKGSKDNCYPTYVEPKTYTFESFSSMSAHLSKLIGDGE